MYNRFGFSTARKQENHPPRGFYSASVKKVSNDQTSFFAKPNQLFESSSVRKSSIGKPFNPTHGFNNLPSTTKSIRSQSFGFSSAKKNPHNLFGMTPQHTRMSNVPASASRLSRVSSSGRQFKDSRPLSDPTYHRECQEKLFVFLTENDYPNQLSKQSLARPSLSDISKIFEFLFSFFQPNITIRAGPETALDVVVPKMMESIGYMFPIKRSDLVSFCGGRQLGSVLAMLDFLVDIISYCQNLDINRLMKPDFEMNELNDESNYNSVLPNLLDIALNFDENDFDEKLDELARSMFGTKEDVEHLLKEQESLEQKLSKLDTEITELVELPKNIEQCTNDIKCCEEYIQEMIENNNARLKIENALKEEIKFKEENMEKLLEENRKLKEEFDSQRDIQIEYRLSIERRKQIADEMEKFELQIKMLKEMCATTMLDINKSKSEFESFLGDIDAVIHELFDSLKCPLIVKFLPDLSKSFELDSEWASIYAQFKQLKVQGLPENVTEKYCQSSKEFSERFLNKLKNDFKMKLLQQLSSLKGTVYIEVMSSHKNRQRECEKAKQMLADQEAMLKKMLEEKECAENEQQSKLKALNEEVESVKMKNVSLQSKLSAYNADEQSLENQVKLKQAEIEKKKFDWMERMSRMVQIDQQFVRKIKKRQMKVGEHLRQDNQQLKQILDDITNFDPKT